MPETEFFITVPDEANPGKSKTVKVIKHVGRKELSIEDNGQIITLPPEIAFNLVTEKETNAFGVEVDGDTYQLFWNEANQQLARRKSVNGVWQYETYDFTANKWQAETARTAQIARSMLQVATFGQQKIAEDPEQWWGAKREILATPSIEEQATYAPGLEPEQAKDVTEAFEMALADCKKASTSQEDYVNQLSELIAFRERSSGELAEYLKLDRLATGRCNSIHQRGKQGSLVSYQQAQDVLANRAALELAKNKESEYVPAPSISSGDARFNLLVGMTTKDTHPDDHFGAAYKAQSVIDVVQRFEDPAGPVKDAHDILAIEGKKENAAQLQPILSAIEEVQSHPEYSFLQHQVLDGTVFDATKQKFMEITADKKPAQRAEVLLPAVHDVERELAVLGLLIQVQEARVSQVYFTAVVIQIELGDKLAQDIAVENSIETYEQERAQRELEDRELEEAIALSLASPEDHELERERALILEAQEDRDLQDAIALSLSEQDQSFAVSATAYKSCTSTFFMNEAREKVENGHTNAEKAAKTPFGTSPFDKHARYVVDRAREFEEDYGFLPRNGM